MLTGRFLKLLNLAAAMKYRIAFAKFITFIVALQILNVSIYALDINMPQQKNVLSYSNEINSIIEYVGEIVLRHSNAFPNIPMTGIKKCNSQNT